MSLADERTLQQGLLFSRNSIKIQGLAGCSSFMCLPYKASLGGAELFQTFIMVFPNKFLDDKPKGYLIDDIDDGLDMHMPKRFVVKEAPGDRWILE